MIEKNEGYLMRLAESYDVIEEQGLFDGFKRYGLLRKNKKLSIYLLLCSDFSATYDVDKILEKIDLAEQSSKRINSYLCIVPFKNASKNMCMFFNGKTFVHFVFYNDYDNSLIYDKKFYYSGGKDIKKMIDVYSECFGK